ncbi:hypothetical protein [Parasediminibacterium sp. JCM 36343]|uniref:hypothetical protein n=1 Tax=Parasediminibacterium sp. JCM 36343 TaxID=3374279 RepID=UPI00397C99CF
MTKDKRKNPGFVAMLFGLLSCVVTVLLFIILYGFLPDLSWAYKLDKVIALLAIAALVLWLVKLFRPIVFVFLVAIGGWFTYKVQNTDYDLLNFYNDSRLVFTNMQTNRNGNFVYVGYKGLSTDKDILNAIDYNNPLVRDFAVSAANASFRKEQQITGKDNNWQFIQSLAVFKKIRTNWNYVSDPAGEEYFAKASESIKLLAGDCDDYAILTAACIKSIGGECRLVCINGHIYPELLIGSKQTFDNLAILIAKKLFPIETKGKKLNYHLDDKGNVWLNLDYTAPYPGGKFMGNDVIEYIYP